MLPPAKQAELRALAERRPDLIEVEGEPGAPSFTLDPSVIDTIALDDHEAVQVMASALAILMSNTGQNAQLWSLGQRVLPLLERAAAEDFNLALPLADTLAAAEIAVRIGLADDLGQAERRLRAMAEGSPCGCALRPLPYRGEPSHFALLEAEPWTTVSEEGYVTVQEQRPRCSRCGAHFIVTKRTDYDRSTWSWRVS